MPQPDNYPADNLALYHERERISFTLFLALLAHIVIFWFVELDIDRVAVSNQREVSLSLVNEAVERADFLSSNSQRGGGSSDQALLPSIKAAPQVFSDQASRPAQMLSGARTSGESSDTSSQSGAQLQAVLTGTSAAPQQQAPQVTEAGIQAQFNQQMQQLQSAINDIEARLMQEQQRLSRQDSVKRITSVSSLAAVEAEYIKYWLEIVETIANMNYPKQASQRGIEGSLRLAVRINANGHILAINTLASSGHKILDDAARNIVRLAEPFAPFPAAMRAEHGAIEIIRTWKFYRQSAALDE